MTLQNGSVAIEGRPTLRVVIPLLPVTLEALRDLGHTSPPREVVLLLREATNRERQWHEAQIDAMRDRPDQIAAQIEFVAAILRKRSEDTPDDVVLTELARDMTETAVAQFTQAFLSGRLEDPKALRAAIRQTQVNMARLMLGAMAAAEPSLYSQPSTVSAPGSATDSPEAS